MTRSERELMRLLHGELDAAAAAALRARLEREPELQAAYRRLEEAWRRLAEPPAEAVDPAFRVEVMERVRGAAAAGFPPLGVAPRLARLLAALAVAAGVALGSGLAAGVVGPVDPAAGLQEEWPDELAGPEEPTLAESYGQALGLSSDPSSEEELP